jgi:GT2 family glycosyltransferase/2-polyprenyl-3-methyl-5-hydroxy-6-metoxy-1,4-benzoquinol methylase
MATARVALIYDDRPRPETTGLYCLRALSTMAHVEHFRPDRLAEASRRNFELYLYVDDGLRYAVPDELHPSAWWAIDTHLDFEWCLAKASAFDVVFAAQRDGAERLREQGIATATWLPLACDPEIHRRHGVDKSVDVCFLGNLVGDERSRLVRLIEEHFPNVLVAQRYFDEMARTYSASRIVFNRSVAGDVNMRVFEALACGSLLVTDDLSENGQAELFRDGVHLATYGGPEELLEKIAFYLERDELREKIAEAGRREVLAKHTYRHRMEKLLAAARKYVSPRQVTAVVPASPPVVRDGSYFEFDRPELLAMVPESARRVLDVGCGTGRLGASIKARQKAEVVGIELDAEAARAATTRLDRVVVGDVEKLDGDLSRERFDCVICGDVLEHLREPDGLLRRASGWLGGDGALVASIPNARHYSVVQSLLSGNWTYERAGLLDRDHVRFFTRREIEKLLYRAGYWIDDLRLVPGAGFEEWRQRGRPGAVQVGRLHVGGMPAHEAEEFYVYQYLLRARPVPIPEQGLTSVVIVTHNQLAYTRLCVGSLLEHTDGPYELIFVDNASTDGTVDYLRALEGATVISNGENRGFPAAANQGIRAATGAQVLLLNNDTVVTTGWLRRLLDALYRDSRIGLVGPCSNCVSGPQQVQVGYDALEGVDGFAWDWGKAHDGRTEETDRLVGFCLLFRRELVERIGPLDERFGVGCFEDDDFTLRARRAGYRAVIARDAFVHHFGGRTFTGSGVDFAALMRENESLFREKWSGAEEVECGKEKCACSKPEGNDEPRKGRCRGGRCDWIARVKQSIARAQRHESRLTPEALALPGMSSDKVRHLLNNLCGCEDVSYLEIGLHAGSTFCAALCNNSIDAVGIENWSQFDPGDARRRFEAA